MLDIFYVHRHSIFETETAGMALGLYATNVYLDAETKLIFCVLMLLLYTFIRLAAILVNLYTAENSFLFLGNLCLIYLSIMFEQFVWAF
jgi:hypothetical protein